MKDNISTMIEFIKSKNTIPQGFEGWDISSLNHYQKVWELFYTINPKNLFYNRKINKLVEKLQVLEFRISGTTSEMFGSEYDYFIKKSNEYRLKLLVAKNNDYAGATGGVGNFQRATKLGITTETGLMVRISDKLSRLEHLLTGTKSKTNDESVSDTIDDTINYLRIMEYCTYLQKQETKLWLKIVNKLNFFSKS